MFNARLLVPVKELPTIQNQVKKFHKILLICIQPFVSKKRICLKTNSMMTIGPCLNQRLSNTPQFNHSIISDSQVQGETP